MDLRRALDKGIERARGHPTTLVIGARLFERQVYRAVGEGYMSESKAAELLAMPVARFHQQRQLLCLI